MCRTDRHGNEKPDWLDATPSPEHKETLSEAKNDAYVAQGIGEDRFHGVCSATVTETRPDSYTSAPNIGGPTQRG